MSTRHSAFLCAGQSNLCKIQLQDEPEYRPGSPLRGATRGGAPHDRIEGPLLDTQRQQASCRLPSAHSGSTSTLPRRAANATTNESGDGKFLGPIRYAHRAYESGILLHLFSLMIEEGGLYINDACPDWSKNASSRHLRVSDDDRYRGAMRYRCVASIRSA